jgi:hypothetical protein
VSSSSSFTPHTPCVAPSSAWSYARKNMLPHTRTLRIYGSYLSSSILSTTLFLAATHTHAPFNWSRDGRCYRLGRWEVARRAVTVWPIERKRKQNEMPDYDFKTTIPIAPSGAANVTPAPRPCHGAVYRLSSTHTIASHGCTVYHSGVVPFLFARSPGSSVFIFTRTCTTPRNVLAHT